MNFVILSSGPVDQSVAEVAREIFAGLRWLRALPPAPTPFGQVVDNAALAHERGALTELMRLERTDHAALYTIVNAPSW